MPFNSERKYFVGTYDADGYCVVKCGPQLARPPMVIDGVVMEAPTAPPEQLDLGRWK
jgi:hypothetical protein